MSEPRPKRSTRPAAPFVGRTVLYAVPGPAGGVSAVLPAVVVAVAPDGSCDVQAFKTSGDGCFLVRGVPPGPGPGTWSTRGGEG